MKDKQAFLDESSQQLTLIFKLLKAGQKPSAEMKYRCEGFIHAGIFMGIASRSEMQQLMDSLHLKVFGESIAAREQKKANKWKDEVPDYRFLDVPTITRRGGRTREKA